MSPTIKKSNKFAQTTRKLLCVAVIVLMTACSTTAHYPVNPPANGRDVSSGYRYQNLDSEQNSNSLAVVLTLSGGGTRAAALAHGVLEEMAETKVYWDGKKRLLLDEIDVISSVSGSSIVAAHFTLHRDLHFSKFPEQFLYANFEASLKERVLTPQILSLLGSPTFGRIELVAEKLDKSLFHGATYNDLIKNRKKPFLIINATDMSTGGRFPFTQEQFDLICADLNAIPLARAVAASSAIPVLFSPLTLNNYASTCSNAAQDAVRSNVPNPTVFQKRRLRELRSYLNDSKRPHLHLLDGGLVDNLGIWANFDGAMLSGGAPELMKEMGFDKLSKAVFIVVSAETDPNMEIDLSSDVPSTRRVAQALDIPIHHNSINTMIQLRETIRIWKQELERNTGRKMDFYLIEVSLRDIKDEAERESFRTIPTSFNLPKADVDRLRQAGRLMLRESPEMQRLMRDMKVDN